MARHKQDLEQLQQAVAEAGEPESELVSADSGLPDQVSMEQLGLEDNQPETGVHTEDTRIRALVEAAVYITDEPLMVAQIASALGQSEERVQSILDAMTAEYVQPHHGLSVREVAGGYQMATKAEHHDELRQFVKKLQPPLKLSLAALETLAVIAYKQPVTAPEILEIRGVQGAGVLKTLLDRKLVQISGRKQVLGKPALYKTTKEFLVQFGLKDLTELPTLKEFEELSRLALGDETEEVEQGELALDAEAEEVQSQVEAQVETAIEVAGGEPGAPVTGATDAAEEVAATTPGDPEKQES